MFSRDRSDMTRTAALHWHRITPDSCSLRAEILAFTALAITYKFFQNDQHVEHAIVLQTVVSNGVRQRNSSDILLRILSTGRQFAELSKCLTVLSWQIIINPFVATVSSPVAISDVTITWRPEKDHKIKLESHQAEAAIALLVYKVYFVYYWTSTRRRPVLFFQNSINAHEIYKAVNI